MNKYEARKYLDQCKLIALIDEHYANYKRQARELNAQLAKSPPTNLFDKQQHDFYKKQLAALVPEIKLIKATRRYVSRGLTSLTKTLKAGMPYIVWNRKRYGKPTTYITVQAAKAIIAHKAKRK